MEKHEYENAEENDDDTSLVESETETIRLSLI